MSTNFLFVHDFFQFHCSSVYAGILYCISFGYSKQQFRLKMNRCWEQQIHWLKLCFDRGAFRRDFSKEWKKKSIANSHLIHAFRWFFLVLRLRCANRKRYCECSNCFLVNFTKHCGMRINTNWWPKMTTLVCICYFTQNEHVRKTNKII